jgi:hypothetical protein
MRHSIGFIRAFLMSQTGQKSLFFYLLLALVVYVAFGGGV